MSSKRNYNSRLFVLFALFIFFIFTTCAAKPASSRDGKPQTGLPTKTITITGGSVTVNVEVELAQTDEQRSTGLMYRTSLEDGKGMLFIFNEDQVLSFWMKNTLIPLSIAYIASDGRILEIYDMEPQNLTPVHSSRSVRYALEVPQGWFSRAGLEPGDRLDIQSFH